MLYEVITFGNNKWYNCFHDQANGAPNWRDGPGTTYWKYNHTSVSGGNLILKASRWNSQNQPNPQYPFPGAWELPYKMSSATGGVNAGCVSSNNKVKYPVFVESEISVANIALASCFWLLSPDDTQEIDIIRITSYNVCYTKLLRRNQHVRVSDNPPGNLPA